MRLSACLATRATAPPRRSALGIPLARDDALFRNIPKHVDRAFGVAEQPLHVPTTRQVSAFTRGAFRNRRNRKRYTTAPYRLRNVWFYMWIGRRIISAWTGHAESTSSGQMHPPEPGRCGHAYARHRHEGGRRRTRGLPRRVYCRPCGWRSGGACIRQRRPGSPQSAHAAHRAPSLLVAVHRRSVAARGV